MSKFNKGETVFYLGKNSDLKHKMVKSGKVLEVLKNGSYKVSLEKLPFKRDYEEDELSLFEFEVWDRLLKLRVSQKKALELQVTKYEEEIKEIENVMLNSAVLNSYYAFYSLSNMLQKENSND